MQTVNTIACAIDFSEASRWALELASDLARRYEARLTLLHVREPAPAALADLAAEPLELSAAARAEAERALARWRADAEHLARRPVFAVVLDGGAADRVVRWAGDHRVDVVVVGTHGRKGLPRLVLGSVAARVARDAPCHVVVARAPPVLDED